MNLAGITVDVQYAVSVVGIPSAESIRQWACSALEEQAAPVELVVRVVDEAEITALNRQYRGKDGPTNVLSFPCEPPPEVASGLLGDIVICAPLVASESIAQHKSLESHWAHLVIHGVLHLLGYDHQSATKARRMEAHETRLLAALGIKDPYREMV